MLGLQRIRNEKFNNWDSILAWLLKSALDTAVSFTYFELKLFLYIILFTESCQVSIFRSIEHVRLRTMLGILTIKISL